MTRSLIVGSGPAAAGVALALAEDHTQQVTVVDIGQLLEPERIEIVRRLSHLRPAEWDLGDLEAIGAQPEGEIKKGLPQKRSYGSDYPFRDVGQLREVFGSHGANTSVVSGAYGGLSNVWGSQVMPFTAATFDQWPVSLTEMTPHYRAILSKIPFAGEPDALDQHFPLIGNPTPLPQLAPRTSAVIAAFDRHRSRLEALGVTVGRARLAFQASDCERCGLCMTGCPYGLIYSAAQTFDRLRSDGRITYFDNLMVREVGQDGDAPYVIARDLRSGDHPRFDADRVYLACGAIGTTRLVLNALNLFDQEVSLGESAQFVLPMVSSRPVPDPRATTEFTLNQFNMVVATDDDWLDVSQIHFYPHNPAVMNAFPSFLQTPRADPVLVQLLRRLTIGLGYLPSWESPRMRVKISEPRTSEELPGISVTGDAWGRLGNRMLRKVALRMLRAAPSLDLWPLLPSAVLSAPGKSYHFGGSFPHRIAAADGPLTTDRLGRLSQWSNVHLVDASVFPNVPATTFTLTIMANAHRIAQETMGMSA